MKISIIQRDVIWEDKSANIRQLENHISRIQNNPDIVVLSEMFTTGFTTNHENLCESPNGDTLKWMTQMASAGNFGICGSYMVRSGKHLYNRWLFVSPDGKSRHYNKRHLFRMDGEEKTFTCGEKRIVFSFSGIRICPNVCYDLRFPVWSRNRNDYDLLINSANWPEAREEAWIILLRARAIENQCYVAGANRAGVDGKGIKYPGHSLIINPNGEILASAGSTEEIVSADISLPELIEFRKKFPAFKDADDFAIIY